MTPLPPATTCPWWQRWWHSRLRRIDRQVLFPAILERAELAATQKYTRLSNEWRIERHFNALAMFDVHARLQGNSHWRCHCSQFVDSQELFL